MTPQQKVTAGVALLIAGSWMIHQGYEGAGRTRPWLTKWLPGA